MDTQILDTDLPRPDRIAARIDRARRGLIDPPGPDAVRPAAAVAANFEMMNRLVDAAGVPVSASMRATGPELEVHPEPRS